MLNEKLSLLEGSRQLISLASQGEKQGHLYGKLGNQDKLALGT